MRFADYTKKLLGLAEVLHRSIGVLAALDRSRRDKVAHYADEIAATLARAAEALLKLEADARDAGAARQAVREFGRITGYLETLVGVLRHHLDGRKLAGVKRRLEQLGPESVQESLTAVKARARLDRLVAAEGYFRALADGLRA
jgi:hypothetical protein